MMRIVVVLSLSTLALAGCVDSGSQATGTLSIAILDTTPSDVLMLAEGAWGLASGAAPAWYRFVDQNASWQMVGSSEALPQVGAVPAGAYEGIRLALNSVQQDGVNAILVEAGFDLPLGFSVAEGQVTTIEVGFSWQDALFQSKDGLAFQPALASLRIIENGVETASLTAQEIEVGGSKPPVARMRIFDPTGLEVFESDFVAESFTDPFVANPGNITFAAAGSETLDRNAEIVSYEWTMPDGTLIEGLTIEHPFNEAGNFTVRLTVTDSNGVSDSQSVVLAVKPPNIVQRFPVSGIAMGVFGSTALSPCGTTRAAFSDNFAFELDPYMAPDGQASIGLAKLVTQLDITSVHPSAVVGVVTTDGQPKQIHGPSNANFPGVGNHYYETLYPPGDAEKQPTAGTWNVQVFPCTSIGVNYQGFVEATWLVGAAGYALWIAAYSDGHDHQH